MYSISPSAGAANRARSFALVLSMAASLAGCFSDPKVNVGAIQHCKTNDNCPSGYVCTVTGTCCPSANGLTCNTIDASTQAEAGAMNSVDSSIGELGVTNHIDAFASDSLQDTSLGGTDASIAVVDTAVPDQGTGTGGAVGQDSANGSGGASGAGGGMDAALDSALDVPQGTGGIINTGGTGTGGPGTGGAPGTGGTTAACQESATQCTGTTSLQTCTNGQWGAPVACGARQTCTGPVGIAKCACNVDPVCNAVGGACVNATILANCAQDAQACFYQSGTSTCTNGSCSGTAGGASCCTNACTAGVTCATSKSLQTCSAGTNGCTAATQTTCASGLVCERYGTAACLDPNWAEWPMPNNQVDTTTGALNPASHTDNGDGTVTDNITKLMWQQTVLPTQYAWSAAASYCSGLTVGGHDDWRLPTAIELVSLVDVDSFSPAINSTYFPSTPTAPFWTSTPMDSTNQWGVYFDDGGTSYIDISGVDGVNTCSIRCVR
jgi:hypothetical protein